MKTRVTIDAKQYDDGGMERAEENLREGNDVIIENVYYNRDGKSLEELAMRFSAKFTLSYDASDCQ